MGKHRPDTARLTRVNFYCSNCGWKFDADVADVRAENAPDLPYHPFRYFAGCPTCGAETPQAAWERALFKAWANSTGPKTAEGKAKVAENLIGHPTPEEARITRFNAMKHGLFARTATYFPAKPGGYPHCSGCEHLETVCATQVACLKRTELFLKHHIAFESRDPGMLTGLRADMQANLQAIIDDMILAIIQDGGPRLISPEWYYDKDGGLHFVEYTDDKTGDRVKLMKHEAHPLLRILMEFVAKNAMTLGDLSMTPKIQDDAERELGYLNAQQSGREQLLDYQGRQNQLLESLADKIDRSRERTQRDPVLIEHKSGSGDG